MSNEENVLKALKEEGDWMSITQVAEKAGLSRTTTSKYLWMLVTGGKAETKRFASAQIFRTLARARND